MELISVLREYEMNLGNRCSNIINDSFALERVIKDDNNNPLELYFKISVDMEMITICWPVPVGNESSDIATLIENELKSNCRIIFEDECTVEEDYSDGVVVCLTMRINAFALVRDWENVKTHGLGHEIEKTFNYKIDELCTVPRMYIKYMSGRYSINILEKVNTAFNPAYKMLFINQELSNNYNGRTYNDEINDRKHFFLSKLREYETALGHYCSEVEDDRVYMELSNQSVPIRLIVAMDGDRIFVVWMQPCGKSDYSEKERVKTRLREINHRYGNKFYIDEIEFIEGDCISVELRTSLSELMDNYPGTDSVAIEKAVDKLVQKIKKFISIPTDFLVDERNRAEIARTVNKFNNSTNSQSTSQKTNSSADSGCYIATAVYGSYDCPQVWTLRRFRDNALASTWYGRAFIKTYYAVSPTLVKWFGKTAWFQHAWRGRLDVLVSRLKEQGVEDTPYQDRRW